MKIRKSFKKNRKNKYSLKGGSLNTVKSALKTELILLLEKRLKEEECVHTTETNDKFYELETEHTSNRIDPCLKKAKIENVSKYDTLLGCSKMVPVRGAICHDVLKEIYIKLDAWKPALQTTYLSESAINISRAINIKFKIYCEYSFLRRVSPLPRGTIYTVGNYTFPNDALLVAKTNVGKDIDYEDLYGQEINTEILDRNITKIIDYLIGDKFRFNSTYLVCSNDFHPTDKDVLIINSGWRKSDLRWEVWWGDSLLCALIYGLGALGSAANTRAIAKKLMWYKLMGKSPEYVDEIHIYSPRFMFNKQLFKISFKIDDGVITSLPNGYTNSKSTSLETDKPYFRIQYVSDDFVTKLSNETLNKWNEFNNARL